MSNSTVTLTCTCVLQGQNIVDRSRATFGHIRHNFLYSMNKTRDANLI